MRPWAAVAIVVSLLGSWSSLPAQEPQPAGGKAVEADPLPRFALRRFGTQRLRHGSRILTLAFSPTGRMLAAGGGNDPIRLWDADTGREIRSFPETWINALVFTKRASVVISAGAFKSIRLWEIATGKDYAKLEGHNAAVKCLSLSPDNTILASGGQDGEVILWEFTTQKIISRHKDHRDEVTCLAFDDDSSLFVSGAGDRTLRLYDVDNGKFLRAFDAGCLVQAVAFVPGSRTFVSGGDDDLLRFWDADSGKLLRTEKGHAGTVVSLATSSRKQGPNLLVSGARDGAILLRDPSGKGEPRSIRRDPGDTDALALTRDGKFVATAGTNNVIRIFDTETLKEVDFGTGHQSGITALALAPAGSGIVTAGADGQVRLWDAAGKTLRTTTVSTATGDIALAFTPDGKLIALAAGTEPIRLWDPASGETKSQLPANPGDPVLSVRFSPDGNLLAVGRRGGAVELWNWRDAKIIRTLKYDGGVYALAFTLDGATLAATGDKKIALFETATGNLIRSFDSKEGPPAALPLVASLAFSPDGTSLAAGCYDGFIRLYDVGTGKELRACEGHAGVPYAIAFAADGRVLGSAGFDRTVRLWEAFSGREIVKFEGHRGPALALGFAPDGRTAYSASADTTVLAWDATRVSPAGNLPPRALQPGEMANLWRLLAADNPTQGHDALWQMVAAGPNTLPEVEKQLYLIDPKKVDQLFKDLGSEKFLEREEATRELEKFGRWMEGRLRAVAKNPPTLEVQRRVDRLLSKLNVPGSISLEQERLRLRRVMMILEQIKGPEALRIFGKLAQGAPEPDLQREAALSIERLKR